MRGCNMKFYIPNYLTHLSLISNPEVRLGNRMLL